MEIIEVVFFFIGLFVGLFIGRSTNERMDKQQHGNDNGSHGMRSLPDRGRCGTVGSVNGEFPYRYHMGPVRAQEITQLAQKLDVKIGE